MRILFTSVKRKQQTNGITFTPRATLCLIIGNSDKSTIKELLGFGLSLSSPIDQEERAVGQREAFLRAQKMLPTVDLQKQAFEEFLRHSKAIEEKYGQNHNPTEGV